MFFYNLKLWTFYCSTASSLEEVDEKRVARHTIDSLKFILDKDLLSEDNLQNDINYQIATLETKKLQVVEW